MKKPLLLFVILFITSCDKTDEASNEFSIIGQWTATLKSKNIYKTPPYEVIEDLKDQNLSKNELECLASEGAIYFFYENGNFKTSQSGYMDNQYCALDEEFFGTYKFEKKDEGLFELTLSTIKEIDYHPKEKTTHYTENEWVWTTSVEVMSANEILISLAKKIDCSQERPEPCEEFVYFEKSTK